MPSLHYYRSKDRKRQSEHPFLAMSKCALLFASDDYHKFTNILYILAPFEHLLGLKISLINPTLFRSIWGCGHANFIFALPFWYYVFGSKWDVCLLRPLLASYLENNSYERQFKTTQIEKCILIIRFSHSENIIN